ncbi:hypothetical protein SUGI_0750230 [Cryptomeria japonica]|nr:hypothetical protein SUGI_0750230 [Cryptomeria japonica]
MSATFLPATALLFQLRTLLLCSMLTLSHPFRLVLEPLVAPLVGVLPYVVGDASVEGSCPPSPMASSSGVVVGASGDAPKPVVANVVGAKVQPKPSWRCSFARVARHVARPSKGVRPLPCAKTSPMVVCGQDVVDNIGFYQRCALVYRFSGLWPSLLDLHHWVSDSWRPLVAHNIELFPCAKGFFIASFTSPPDRDLVLDKLWAWGVHSLSVKPWSTSFNPLTKPLNVHPV